MSRARLPAFFAPPVVLDAEEARRARALNAVLWLMIVGTLFSTGLATALGSWRPVLYPLFLAFVGPLFWLRQQMFAGRIRQASHGLTAVSWLVIGTVLAVDGIDSPALGSLVAIVIIAAALLGTRVCLIYTAASLVLVGAFYGLETRGWIQPDKEHLTLAVRLSTGMFQILVIGLMIAFITRDRDRAYARTAALVDGSPDGILVFDASGVIRSANPAAHEIGGLEPGSLVGRRLDEIELIEPGSLEEALGALGRVFDATNAGEPPLELRVRRPDGARIYAECNARRVRLEDDSPGVQITARDVTRRRIAEDQVLQTQKLESIGRLAGGIAHDFNNILMTILANAEMLRDTPTGRPPPEAGQILEAAERARRLTRQLLLFSRADVAKPTDVDLGEVVGGLEDLLRRLIGEDITLAVKTCRAIVRADPSQLEQIVMNLAVNARDAMPAGGILRVSVALEKDERGIAPRQAVLRVEDSGAGMDEQTRRHAFDPFFTTKGTGRGTGLGLAVVHGIVERCGGEVEIDSQPGSGTSVSVRLPTIAFGQSAPPPEQTQAPTGQGETVLLVEDDESVRGAARRILTDAGYDALEADGPESALQLSRSHPGRIDLLLSDVIMPTESGADLARRLLEERPELRVLLMSGYTGDALEPHLGDGFVAPLIEKPFTSAELRTRIRSVLDDPD